MEGFFVSSMISPNPLHAGDKIGLVATARRVTLEQMRPAIDELKSWGIELLLSPHLYNTSHSYLAGTDEERLTALQQFLDDPSITAIICARGGYGTTRIIDSIDFKQFTKHPKWLVGFSDITALHLKLASLGFESIHGTMPILFSQAESRASIDHLKAALFGETLELRAAPNSYNRRGEGRGALIGGNLSLIVDAIGTSHDPDTDGKILVLEEVDEYLYKIDRMMVQLKRAGKLEKLAGLVVGHFTECKETELNFGESEKEIIRYHTKEFNYPIGFGFPTGHENPNLSWIQGREAILNVGDTQSTLIHSSSIEQDSRT
jgi:muramoyltetrapeptide carboxypeptidase